jgi:hypothetical protein
VSPSLTFYLALISLPLASSHIFTASLCPHINPFRASVHDHSPKLTSLKGTSPGSNILLPVQAPRLTSKFISVQKHDPPAAMVNTACTTSPETRGRSPSQSSSNDATFSEGVDNENLSILHLAHRSATAPYIGSLCDDIGHSPAIAYASLQGAIPIPPRSRREGPQFRHETYLPIRNASHELPRAKSFPLPPLPQLT